MTGDPVSVRLKSGDRARLDDVARRQGMTRSALLRRLVAESVATDPEMAAVVRGQRVRYSMPVIEEDFTPGLREAIAVRNATALSGLCPSCGARGHIDDESALQPVTPRAERVQIAPSTSTPASPGGPCGATVSMVHGTASSVAVTRFVAVVHYSHAIECPAAVHYERGSK